MTFSAKSIQNVSIIGSGTLGRQIALLCAIHGFKVKNYDSSTAALASARTWVDQYLAERLAKGKLDQDTISSARSRLDILDDSQEAVREADIVIEAVVEKLEVKREVFSFLDRTCPKHTIFTTNSSTIVSSKLADATARPERVCNLHFFNPALVMELVEVVKGPHVSDETAEIVMDFARRIKKHPILIRKEIAGFVVNRILKAITDEALYLLENDVATPREIDEGVTKGLRHPIGPFALMDFNGIDVTYLVREQRYRESGDLRDKPSPLLTDKFKKGEWGRKAGKGWYDYTAGDEKARS